ncbi:MAG TPA: carbohydrate ABC transporter permease [Pseudonocardiaceae bacterium]
MTVLHGAAGPAGTGPLGLDPERRATPGRRGRPRLGTVGLLVGTCLVTLVPFVVMLLMALSPPDRRTLPEVLWPEELSLRNFEAVLRGADLVRWGINSLVYSAVSTVVVLLLATMAGYSFARKRWPGRDLVFAVMLATLMVPFHVSLIPYFMTVGALGGIDTYWGMILPTVANVQAVFLMRQYLRSLPEELFEAARVDGASEWLIFLRIVVPLARPAMAAIGVFVFIWHWNDFLWPLLVAQSEEMRTLTVGLASLRAEVITPQELMAGATLTVVPCLLVFALFQRYLVDSVATTGLRG